MRSDNLYRKAEHEHSQILLSLDNAMARVALYLCKLFPVGSIMMPFSCCAPGELAVDTILLCESLELITNDRTEHNSVISASDHSENWPDFDMVADDLTLAKGSIWTEGRVSRFAPTEPNQPPSTLYVSWGDGVARNV